MGYIINSFILEMSINIIDKKKLFREFLKVKLNKIYFLKFPQKINNINDFFEKYYNREYILYQKVCKKYFIKPDIIPPYPFRNNFGSIILFFNDYSFFDGGSFPEINKPIINFKQYSTYKKNFFI